MATLIEISEDSQKIFDEIIEKTNLDQVLNIDVLVNNELKTIGLAAKANDYVKFRTEKDVIVIINEEIFKTLEDAQKLMVADEILASVSYDSEKDKIVITKPDIIVHSGVLRKYNTEPYLKVVEIIKLALQQKEDAAKEARASKNKKKNSES